ncbi:MAG: molybdate ABC transporter substrate-binding protein [Pseudomonadota bacterium]
MKRLLLLLALICPELRAAELTVAAASSYRPLLTELAEQFEQREQHQVRLVFGSSGKLATQIIRGAPFDLFFSANVTYIQRLKDKGLLAGAVITDGYGQLVLWSRASGPLVQGPELLKNLHSQRVVLAQPKHAPYGQAAKAYLQQQQIYDSVRPHLVYSENVAQAVHMVHSGAASLGFVALSVIPPEEQIAERMYRIPLKDKALLRQTHAVLASAEHEKLARQFSEFVQRKEFDALKLQHGINPERTAVANE